MIIKCYITAVFGYLNNNIIVKVEVENLTYLNFGWLLLSLHADVYIVVVFIIVVYAPYYYYYSSCTDNSVVALVSQVSRYGCCPSCGARVLS